MHSKIAAIEHDFRSAWRGFDPIQYDDYLAQVPESDRHELLTRLLSAELEFSYSPPSRLILTTPGQTAPESDSDLLTAPQRDIAADEDDDERVRPCVQLFWVRFPELRSDESFFIRLIVLEYALRMHHDRLPPNPESYLGLCGESEQQRLMALLQLTETRLPAGREMPVEDESPNHTDSTTKDANLPSLSFNEPLPMHLGSYLLVRLIGRGGMGFVYSAIDLQSTARIALKRMRRVDAWSVYRFFEEFRWLSQLEHPNLVKLYNAHTEGESRYFSMELVEGHTINHWFNNLPKDTDVRWTVLRKVLSQLASAISYLHNNQVIHCDIKCSNMMITARSHGVVLDLGLAVREGQTNPVLGTIQYMAPEVIDRSPPSAASDWYSFGVMIFEVMTGNYPPIEVSTTDAGKTDYTARNPKLVAQLEGCPDDLAELCLALLSSQPDQRPTANQVLDTLGGKPLDRPQVRHSTHCPGRENEISELKKAHAAAIKGDRRSVVIHGESGIGKSLLLRTWMQDIDNSNSLLASIRCYFQDHTPNRTLNSLVQDLVLCLADVPEVCWKPALEKRLTRVTQLFPQAAQLLGDQQPTGTSHQPTRPAPRKECIRALIDWLADISRHRPFTIAVDDAQWADQESINALMGLQQNPTFCGLIVLVNNSPEPFLPCLTTEDGETSQREADFTQTTRSISVPPLSPSTCSRLLSEWTMEAGIKISKPAIQRLTRFSGGNPFLLQELAHAYIYDYATVSDDAVQLIGNSDAQNAVRRRFASLPREAELTLEFLAVANHPLGFHQLQMLTRILPQNLLRSLSLLRSQGWVRPMSSNSDSDVEVAHERFRKAIVQGIPEDRIRRRHVRIARILSSDSPQPWARIAAHFWAADRIPDAATCYYEAARNAYVSGAIEEALFFLERASHTDAVRTLPQRLTVLRLKADCLASMGSSRAAAEAYEFLSQQVNEDDRLVLNCLAGEQWIRAGQPELGIKLLHPVLSHRNLLQRATTRFGSLRLIGRLVLTKPPTKTKTLDEPFNEVEACLNRIATPLTYLENRLGQDLIAGNARLAQTKGTLADRAQAVSRTGVTLSFAGKRFRLLAARRLRAGRELAQQSGLDSAMATWNFCMFVWYIQQGNIRRAIRHSRLGVSRLKRCRAPHYWEQQCMKWGVLCSYFYSNQFHQLRESTASFRETGQRRDDPMTTFWMHTCGAHWADLVADEVLAGRKSLFVAEKSIANLQFQLPRFFLWHTRIQQSLYEGDAAGAQNLLLQDWKQLARSVVLSTSHYRWMALHTRICCDLLSARQQPARRRRWLADARRCGRRMLTLDVEAFVAYARALLLVIDALDGKIASDSRWQFEISNLHRLDHHVIAAGLQWHYSLYSPDSDDKLASSRRQLTEQGCANPAKLLNIVIPLPQ